MSRRRNPYARADAKTRSAKAAGYPARSVHKLREIDRRCQLLRRGDRVLDLGAAPGSWSLYASERVGVNGRVVAVDLKEIAQRFGPQVTVLQGNALEPPPELASAIAEGGPYDVVLSDMAPNTSGDHFTDSVRSFELFMAALGVARRHGSPGGHFVAKIFMGEDFPAAKAAVTDAYGKCRIIKPEGTRANSTEIYIVGLGLKQPEAALGDGG